MPFSRPTLSQLKAQVAADIAGSIKGTDALLRFAALTILGKVLAGLANLTYGFLDWIAKQAVPFTSSGEYLAGWGALRSVYIKEASYAQVTASFAGTIGGDPLDAGSTITRGDGIEYTVNATVSPDPSTGAIVVTMTCTTVGTTGNCDVGTVMNLAEAVGGINSAGAVTATVETAADIETQDAYYERVMAAYQKTPQGGDEDDYIGWAEAVSGVTRAWIKRNGMGSGTVVVYIMLDTANAATGGFPTGTDGCATKEDRAPAAIGDQLTVANALYLEQPVTALVYVVSPLKNIVPFTITGLTDASTTLRASIDDAIDGVFLKSGDPTGSTVDLSDVNTAIAALSGTAGFLITSPVGNIVSALGYLPVRGAVTYP